MSLCEVDDCPSNGGTRVDGREVNFFPFPKDDTRREQWLQNCKLTAATNKQPYLCELHFEKVSFTTSGELKPNAVPTVFTKAEGFQRKHKSDTTMHIEKGNVTPAKQRKLDENSHDSMVTPPLSPIPQLVHNMKEETVKMMEDNKERHPKTNILELNGTTARTSEKPNQLPTGKRTYRLTIQIDKIRAKPGPKSKKFMSVIHGSKLSHVPIPLREVEPEDQTQHKLKRVVCAKGGCKLKKAIFDSKPAFQCENCDKFYVVKKEDNVQQEKVHSCSICYKTFSSPQSLYLHTKKHFICDMCQTECSSQVTFDKHTRLHVSTDALFPYKCHQCTEIFELREDVKQHYLIMHPTIQLQNTILKMTPSPVQAQQKEYRCVACNITFRNEQAYRNHVSSHKQKEGLRCNISETNNIIPVPNPLTGSQIGILRAVKFSCRVCSKEFDNVGEVDKHTRTHLEDVEENQKCNICKKQFKSSTLLNEHLKHHLSRAHPCPICPKAFINRTTLKIHLKRHTDA